MARHTKVIDGDISIKPALDWAYGLIMKGLVGGAVAIDIYRHEEKRNNQQNALAWALWTEIANQVEWYGHKLTAEHWKELLSNEWKNQDIVPGISGGFCAIGVSTSKMTKREFSEVVEITFAFGSSKGVKFTDKTLADYSSYKEANI